MGWRSGEVWLEADLLWFRKQPRARFGELALALPMPGIFPPVETGLEASRRRRLAAQAARRRRFATRTVPAVALVLGSSTMLPMMALRQANGAKAGPLAADPPSLTFRFDRLLQDALEAPLPRQRGAAAGGAASADEARGAEIAWGAASSAGVHYSGHLHGGTRLPLDGPDWVTWNPVTDSVPNAPRRLYGHERTIRAILAVTAAYREANPQAPPVVVGDISFRDGGPMEQHVSHQNGLDVDVYYPRQDRRAVAPVGTRQVDRGLAQDLLDRFLAAGAGVVFVGYSTGLRGPGGVVVPYPNHEDHMHVRFPRPAS